MTAPGKVRSAASAARELLRAHAPPWLRSRVRELRRRWRRARGLPSEDIARWEQRAQQFGARAVYNIGHAEDELARVTALQKAQLYPILEAQIGGGARLVLDLGCGPGRFTADLARLAGGRAVGVDPIQKLLDLAPRAPNVEFRRMAEGRIPLADGEADVVWICLVLGGLRGDVLRATVAEVLRVLERGGLLFLVENTTEAPDSELWRFRSVSDYQRLLEPLRLAHLHDYEDLGERISIFAGRHGS